MITYIGFKLHLHLSQKLLSDCLPTHISTHQNKASLRYWQSKAQHH